MKTVRNSALATKVTVRIWAIGAVILLSHCLSAAQEITRFDVFGGYSYFRFDSKTIGFANQTNTNGWYAGGAFNIGDSFSVVAEGSGNYGSKLSLYHYMVGPQYSWRFEKSRLFAHALFGKAQDNVSIAQPTRSGFESVGRSFAAGGGYDRDITNRFSWRVVQVDYLNTHVFGVSQNNIRVTTGVVVHLGRAGRKPRL